MDTPLVEHTQGGNRLLLIQLPTTVEGRKVFLDATRHLRKASQLDRNNGYSDGNGPNFGIEVEKAREYAEYVSGYVQSNSVARFNTRNYTFFLEETTEKEGKSNVRGDSSKQRRP